MYLTALEAGSPRSGAARVLVSSPPGLQMVPARCVLTWRRKRSSLSISSYESMGPIMKALMTCLPSPHTVTGLPWRKSGRGTQTSVHGRGHIQANPIWGCQWDPRVRRGVADPLPSAAQSPPGARPLALEPRLPPHEPQTDKAPGKAFCSEIQGEPLGGKSWVRLQGAQVEGSWKRSGQWDQSPQTLCRDLASPGALRWCPDQGRVLSVTKAEGPSLSRSRDGGESRLCFPPPVPHQATVRVLS